MLFQQKRTGVLTSATLATDSNFGFLRQRLGFPDDCDELLVEQSFQLPTQHFAAGSR